MFFGSVSRNITFLSTKEVVSDQHICPAGLVLPLCHQQVLLEALAAEIFDCNVLQVLGYISEEEFTLLQGVDRLSSFSCPASSLLCVFVVNDDVVRICAKRLSCSPAMWDHIL